MKILRKPIQKPFIENHWFWEHEKASLLAKITRPKYFDIDYDSDILLESMYYSLWMDDIIGNNDTVSTELYNMALEDKMLFDSGANESQHELRDLLVKIIDSKYVPLQENVEKYEALLEDVSRPDYMLSIAAYPAENLFHYVHDKMLYMNYIQCIVVHDNEAEKEMVASNRLLMGLEGSEGFSKAIEGIRGWWV